MNKGLIYLIQPTELIETNRYKIGMSKNPNLDRCKNGYKKGSRYLCIMECIEPLILEQNIKNHFNEKFKLIAGNEYYEGTEKDILNTFNNLVMEYNNTFINITKIDENDICIDEIKNTFENYKEDEAFGGTKKLIKIYINRHHNVDDIKRHDYIIEFIYIDEGLLKNKLYFNDINGYSYNYVKKIIDKKIIQTENIYDLNDCSFQKKINQCKKIYNDVIFLKETIEKITKNQEFMECEKNTIEYLFKIDCLINDLQCCSNYDEYSFYSGHVDFKIYQINKKYYDYLYLRKNIPYCIEYNKITKNYYVINRDYEYIGYDKIKCLENIENDITQNDRIRIYLFNDDNTPWINFKNYLKKFNLEKINNSLNILNNNNFDYDLFC